jgi:hypothetical protein
VIWQETHASRRRQEAFVAASSAELQYVGFGTTDDDEAETALRAEMPLTFRGLPLRSWSMNPLGGDCWEASANYAQRDAPEPPDAGEVRFSCDTTGGSVHITQSLATTKYAKSGETAPDYKGAIGVQGDTVQGVDIVTPTLKFQLTYRMPKADLTLGYVLTLYALTGKVNSGTWKGFAAGELLFLGATADEKNFIDPTVTFKFAASPNATNISVGGNITVTNKGGHQYLWIAYEKADDSAAKKTVQNPKAAYVETVYSSGNFALLGIGS